MNTLSPLVAKRTLAFIVLLAIAVWSFGLGTWIHTSEAAALTTISDLLSDSDLGVNSNHTITFSNPTAIAEGDTITITFPGEFNVSTSTATLGLEDFDLATSTENTLGYDCTGTENMSVATSGQTVVFTVCSGDGGAIAAGGTTTIEIGAHAASGGNGDNQIINPTSAQSYEIAVAIAVSQTDSGTTRVAIIDDVVVTASVDTTFTFTINAMPQGYAVNGSPTTTTAASTATTLPFGTITPGPTGSKTLAQNLTVTTNATNGFTVTLNQDQNLLSSTGADIDRFIDDAATASSTAWVGPTGTIGNETTYGHMGITSEDETASADAQGFFDDLWAGNFVNNAREVFYNDGPSDGVTADQGSTTVGFQVEISSLQEAGSDYTANITYVATPIF